MKKCTGNYTPDASKALKGSQRLICRTAGEGEIYVTNGCTAYKMFPWEYSSVVQPVTCCEAGNYSIQNGEKRDEVDFDLEKTFLDAVKAANDAGDMARCPLVLTLDKKRTAAAYYNAEKDFVALYDTRYISALSPGFTLRAPGPKAAAVAYVSGEPVALILPIRPDENATRAVKAYFAQAAGQEAPIDLKTTAEIIAARFTGLDGVTATIKGAHTAAPVVWLSGDTDKHADEIKAAGAKWSGKRSAYYVRVA